MSDSDFGPPRGTFGDGNDGGPPPRTIRGSMPPQRSPLVTALVIGGALLLVVATVATFWTEVLWYQSVDFSGVFSKQIVSKVVLGVIGGVLTAAAVWSSIHVAYRTRPIYAPSPDTQAMEHYRQLVEPMRRTATVAAPLAIGLFAGLSSATQWDTFLLWRNGTPFGTKDPEFGLDIGFFVFDLPWINFVLSFLTMILVLALIAAAFTHYLYGGIVAAQKTRTTQAARVHLSVIAGALVLVRGAAFWVDRYNLANAQASRMTGIQYTEAHAVIPTKGILAVAAIMCAVMFLTTIWTRSWRLPLVGVAVLAVVVVAVGGIYPALVQSLKVRPSEKSLELPYIERNIAATRAAYGFDKVKVEKYSAAASATSGQLRNDAATVPGIRLIDPNVVSPTFNQLEASRGYYQFADVLDVDRYRIDGQVTDTVIAARELNLEGVPDGQRNWLNDHTVYTHGYGVVAARGNTREDDGRPTFFESQIGTTGVLGKYEPRIYFGETSPEYSIVGGGKKEFDYPTEGTGQATNTYAGAGGVPLDSMRRLAYAFKYREINFLLSDAVTNESKILDHRTPRERVQRVAPWLTLDGNAYPVVVDGRVQWVLDGYTTTDMYPYSEMASLDTVTEDAVTRTRDSVQAIRAGQVNYVRNSVKATVDAYDGTVTLYEWDQQDPILKAWRQIFPGTVKPMSAIKGSLMEHLRYPEDLFKIQRQLMVKYHETDASTFYGGQTFWRVPDDPTQAEGFLQPPYYLSLAMPGTSKPSFSLTSTFMPTGDKNILSGFLAVDGDAGMETGKRAPEYGTLRLLETTSALVNGPGQVFNDMRTSGVSSKDFTLPLAQFITTQQQGAAPVIFGNQLTLPVGGGVLYVQPIYVQSKTAGSSPRLQAVAVAFGNKIAWAASLDGALNELFGGSSGAQAGDTGTNKPPVPGRPGTPTGTPTGQPTGAPTTPAPTGTPDAAALQRALADAQKAYTDGQEALRRGDFAAYGKAQERLKEALARAVSASPRGQ